MSDADGIAWDYVGEFIDPDQSPLTASLYSCSDCAALVASMGRDQHARWHATLQVAPRPAAAARGLSVEQDAALAAEQVAWEKRWAALTPQERRAELAAMDAHVADQELRRQAGEVW